MEEFDKACFDDDLTEVLTSEVAKRCKIEKMADLEVSVALEPRVAPAEAFVARLRWTSYPSGLPSLKFLDGIRGGESNPKAWPTGQGMRAPSLDSCMHWTSEGHGLHPEWNSVASYRLDAEGNVLRQALMFLRQWFDNDYTGRHQ